MSGEYGEDLLRLLRNTAALSATQMARVGVNALLSLLVARQLGAEGLGKYAVVIAYLNIFQVVAVTGVPRLTIREMARQPARGGLWFQRMVVNQLMGAGVSAVLLMAAANLLNHPPDTTLALGVIALSLLPFALSSAAESAFQARERMEIIPLAQMGAGTVQVVGSRLLLLAGRGVVALAWMVVGGQVVAAAIEMVIAGRMGLWRDFHLALGEAVGLFRRSFDFFLLSLSVVLFSRLDVLILSQMAGERAVGLYNAAYLVVRVINFLSISYSHALYPVMSRLFSRAQGRFEALLRRSLRFGLAATLLVSVLLAAAAGPIIGLLYGKGGYAASVPLLRIEAPFAIIFLWNALLSSGLMASNRQRRSVIVSGVKLGAALVYYPVLTAWLGVMGAAIATVLAGLTGAMLNTYFIHREVCPLRLVDLVGRPLLAGMVVGAGLWLSRGLAWPGRILGGVLLYGALLILLRILTAEDLLLLRRAIRPAERE